MKTSVKLLVCAALLAAVPSLVSAQSSGYSVTDETQRLYQIDLTTAIATDRGPVGTEAELEGLFSIGSVLYGYNEYDPARPDLPTQLRQLLRPQPQGSLQIGITNIQFGTESGAAYNPSDGYVYVIHSDDLIPAGQIRSRFYRFKPSQPEAIEQIGNGSTVYVDGLAIDGQGRAFASDFRISDSLYRLNLNTGALTLVGAINFGFNINRDSGLAYDFDNDVLYGLSEEATLYRLSTSGNPVQATVVGRVRLADGTPLIGDFEGFDIPTQNPLPEE